MVSPVGANVQICVSAVYTLEQVKRALAKYYSNVILHRILVQEDQTEESHRLREQFLPFFSLASADEIIQKWTEFAKIHQLPPFQIE